MIKAQTYTRNERLRGKKLFADLFSTGKSFNQTPFRITWKMDFLAESASEPLQASFVVPKRNFKRAAHRNRIRRRMKEAFRLQKSELKNMVSATGNRLIFVCIYTGKEENPYTEIENKIIVTLHRLAQEVSKARSGLPTP